MRFIRDFSKFRELRINEALESGQFLVYHRTRLVEQSYVVDQINPEVNFYQNFAEKMIPSTVDKEKPEYEQHLKRNIKLLVDMNPSIKLDERGFPILKNRDKIVTQSPRIISQGFRAGAGDFYGVGLYTCYEFDDQIRDFDRDGRSDMASYGQNIVEFKVENTGKFLILDMTEGNNQAKKVWGSKHTLIDQLKKIMGGKFLKFYNNNKELIDGFNEILVKTKYTKPDGVTEELKTDAQGRFLTGPIGKVLCEMTGFISLVDGISFTGNNDGRVLVVYEVDLAKPTRYTSDDGGNWTPMAKLDYQYEKVRSGNKEILQCKIIDNDKELLQVDPDRSSSMKWLTSIDLPEILKDKEKSVQLFSQMNIDVKSLEYFDKLVDELSKNKPQVLDNIIKRLNELPVTNLKIEESRVGIYLSNFIYFLKKFIDKVGSISSSLNSKVDNVCIFLTQNIEKVSIPIEMVIYLSKNIDSKNKVIFQELINKSEDLYSEKIQFQDCDYLNIAENLTEESKFKIDEALDILTENLLNKEIEIGDRLFIHTDSDFRLFSYKIGSYKKILLLLSTDFENLSQKYFDKVCKILQKYLKVLYQKLDYSNFGNVDFFRNDFIRVHNSSISNTQKNTFLKMLEFSNVLNDDSIDILADAVIYYLAIHEEENIGYGSKNGQKYVSELIKGTKIEKRIKEKLFKFKNGESVEMAGVEKKISEYGYQKYYEPISKYIKLDEEFLPELDYSEIADKIFKSMYGFGVKEDELLYQFGKLRNNTDFNKMKSAFGSRKGAIGKEYDLDYWIKDELKQKDLDKLNDLLKEKGINYQF